MTQRWMDVMPHHWYYRDVLEAERIKLDLNSDPLDSLIRGIPYNKFVSDKPRLVKAIIATANQTEFPFPGYVPHPDNPVFAYVDGIRALVGKTERDKVILANPVSAGVEVILMSAGVVEMTPDPDGCGEIPTWGADPSYPRVDLGHKDEYTFNIYYHLNESCVALDRALKPIRFEPFAGETLEQTLQRQIGYRNDVFIIHEGTLYVPYSLHEIPVTVCYNYMEGGSSLRHICERVVPKAPTGHVLYNDRFFPDVKVKRYEFFVFLYRMKKAIYNRFTDRKYANAVNNERNIPDVDQIPDWAKGDVLDMLNEKFLDGCYVFPLYEDGTIKPKQCITRAESVVYLHRFIEWALERFR